MTRPSPLERIDHVAFRVRDLKRSIDWYERVLGLTRIHAETWDQPAVLHVGGTALALFQAPEGWEAAPRDGRPVRHVAFLTDADGFVEMKAHLDALGIEWRHSDFGAAESVFFDDPDGNEVEVTRYRG